MDARTLAGIAIGTLVAFAADAQSLFKCVQPNGRVVYQDSACDDSARQSTLRAPAAAPAPAKPADPKAGPAKAVPGSAAPPAPAPADETIGVVAAFSVCSERVPNFAFKYGAAYEDWKAKNAAALVRLSSEPDASRLDERLRSERARPTGDEAAVYCARIAEAVVPAPGAK